MGGGDRQSTYTCMLVGMANMTIYLPPDLAAEVKASGMNASAVCQRALRDELTRPSQVAKLAERAGERRTTTRRQ